MNQLTPALPTSRTFRPVLIAAALLLFWSLPFISPEANAQTGDDALRFAQRTPGLNARNMGTGGAGTAGVADAAAFVLNPAGLGWSKSSWFSASIHSQATEDDGVFNAPGSSTSLEDEFTSTDLGSAAYAYRLPTTRGSMVVGASFAQVSSFDRSLFFDGNNSANSITDFFIPFSDEFILEEDDDGVFPTFDRTLSFIGFETFAIDLDSDLVDAGDPIPFLPAVSAGTIAQTGFVEESGRMNEISFGGAIEVSKDVMVGLSINIPFGTYEFRRVLEEDDFLNDNDGTNGTTDFSFLRFTEQFESDLVGVNGRLGISAKVNEHLMLGANIETPTYYSVEDDFFTLLETEFDNGDFFSYGDDPSQRAGSGSFDYNITTPWKLSAGASYNTGNLTLLADAEWIDWSQMELDADGFSFRDENQAIRRGLESVVNVRFGASYDYKEWQFRAGAGASQDPHTTTLASIDVQQPDRERAFASAGVGYKISSTLSADVAWMVEEFDDRYNLYTEVTDAPFVSEEVTRNRFQLGFSFRF